MCKFTRRGLWVNALMCDGCMNIAFITEVGVEVTDNETFSTSPGGLTGNGKQITLKEILLHKSDMYFNKPSVISIR